DLREAFASTTGRTSGAAPATDRSGFFLLLGPDRPARGGGLAARSGPPPRPRGACRLFGRGRLQARRSLRHGCGIGLRRSFLVPNPGLRRPCPCAASAAAPAP